MRCRFLLRPRLFVILHGETAGESSAGGAGAPGGGGGGSDFSESNPFSGDREIISKILWGQLRSFAYPSQGLLPVG